MKHHLAHLTAALLALACGLVPPLAHAAYPDKPVRIIVPFSPGGGTDLVARTLGVGLAQALGVSVLIENKPGAGTVIGTDLVAKSAPTATPCSSPPLPTPSTPAYCPGCPTPTTPPSRPSS